MIVGPLRFIPHSYEVWREGMKIELKPIGYKLLNILMQQSPRVLSRQTLEREIWNDNPPDSDALRTHIHAIRQVIDKPFRKPMLKTIQGIGYCLIDPDE